MSEWEARPARTAGVRAGRASTALIAFVRALFLALLRGKAGCGPDAANKWELVMTFLPCSFGLLFLGEAGTIRQRGRPETPFG